MCRKHSAGFLAISLVVTACLALLSRHAIGQTLSPATVSAGFEIPPAVIISGQPEERGRMYGRHFRDGIKHFLDTEVYQAFVDKPNSKEELLRYAAECAKVVESECPIIYQELTGIAAGSGLTLNEMVLITLHDDLYHREALPHFEHCTAVAVSSTDNKEGHTYVGQTWDWMPSMAGMSSLIEWRREEGPSVLAYNYPGLWAGAGMNERGIALCWTSAALGDHSLRPRVGLPGFLLVTHLLYQNDLESIIRIAQRDKHAGWFTFLIADAEGHLLNIEGSPQGVVVERSNTHLGRHMYGTKQMAGVLPDGRLNVHRRCQKINDLLDGSTGNNSREVLQNYFTDPLAGILVPTTIDIMVFDLTSKTAYVSRVPRYNPDWREFQFDRSGDTP